MAMSPDNHFKVSAADERKKLDGLKLFDLGSSHDENNAEAMLAEKGQDLLQSEPKYDLRKSLAWDSAFFTSPGVLEPEELFINSRVKDSSVNILGQEEEILLPSESLEPEIFSRFVRSSFRKSLAWDNAFFTSEGVLDPEELSMVNKGFKRCEIYLPGIEEVLCSTELRSTVDSGASSLTSLEIDIFEDTGPFIHRSTNFILPRGKASKKLDASSKRTIEGIPTIGRQVNSRGNYKKGGPLSFFTKKQLEAESVDLKLPSAKPLKILTRTKHTQTLPRRRASICSNLDKMGTAEGKCKNKSDKSSPEESCTSTHSSSPSKISSCSSSIVNEHTVSQSSNERSSCALPNTSTESSFHSIKKQIHPIDVNISANDSSLRTPLRYRIKEKSTLPSSCNPACAFYTSMAHSFTSPCSSFDRWSSESFQDPTLKSHLLYAQTSFSKKNIERRLPYRGDKKMVTGSSLRLPSPKIGFFDEQNPSVPTIDGMMQFHYCLPSATSKVKTGTSDATPNRARYGKSKPQNMFTRPKKQNGCGPTLQVRFTSPKKVEEVKNASPKETPTYEIVEALSDGHAASKLWGACCSKESEHRNEESIFKQKMDAKHVKQVYNKNKKEQLKEYGYEEQNASFCGNNLSVIDDKNKENIHYLKD